MQTARTTPRVGPRLPSFWPFVLMPVTIALNLILAPVMKAWHVPLWISPWAILLVWAPFLWLDWRGRQRAVRDEKAAMEARFEAEDVALFGRRSEEI